MLKFFKQPLSSVIATVISFLTPALTITLLPPGWQLANSPDSLYYLEASQQIASGMGLTISNFSLFNKQLVEFTIWPPLYPFILASGLPPILIHAITMGALSMVTYRIFYYLLKQNIPLSILLGLFCTLSTPLILDASYVWSEILSILCICVLLYSLTKISNETYRTPWTMAVICIALAIYTRYSMFLLVPGTMIALLAAPINRSLRIKLSLTIPFGVLLLISPLIIHNYFSTGHISGAKRAPSDINILENISYSMSNTISTFISWNDSPWYTYSFIFVLGITSLAHYAIKYNSQKNNKILINSSNASSWLTKISLTLALSYFAGMIFLRTMFDFDRLDIRLMSPAAYLIYISICSGFISTWIKFSSLLPWKRYALASPFVVLIAISTYNSINQSIEAWVNWHTTGSPDWHVNSSSKSTYRNLQPANAPKIEGAVLCNRPLFVKFYTDWDARNIPEEPWSDIDLKRIASSSSAIFVNGPGPRMLAQRIKPLLKNYTEFSFEGSTLLSWHASEHQK